MLFTSCESVQIVKSVVEDTPQPVNTGDHILHGDEEPEPEPAEEEGEGETMLN